MIPQYILDSWKKIVPWQSLYQIEQDLVICRALIEIFSNPILKKSLAFRGGTALHKLFLMSETRYSEDIDLVVCEEGAVGYIFDELQKNLNSWLGKPKRIFKENRANLIYRFNSEDASVIISKLKIEINTVEDFCVDGFYFIDFSHNSDWFKGSAKIKTFTLNEILATKLRALYQRKKGRDLFDLYFGLKNADVDATKLINIFLKYMDFSDCKVSRAQFELNMSEKIKDPIFRDDISSLLVREKDFDIEQAYLDISSILLAKLPGEPWKGK